MANDFDKKTLMALEASDKRYRIQDPKTPGLNLVIHPSGRKTWTIIKRPHGGKPISRFVGTFPDMTIFQARAKAAEELNAIATGVNRNQEARQQKQVEQQNVEAAITLGEARLRYLASKNVFEDVDGNTYFKEGLEVHFSPGSIKDYRTFINHYMRDWRDKPLRSITESDVIARYQHLKNTISLARANSAMRILRAIYNQMYLLIRGSERKPLLPENPVPILGKSKIWKNTKRKKSIIRRANLPDWYATLQRMKTGYASKIVHIHHAYITILLYTGLRPSHILPLAVDYNAYQRQKGAARGYYDKEAKLLYFFTQKNDTELEIPVARQVVEVIEALPVAGDWLIHSANSVDIPMNADIAKMALNWVSDQSGVRATPSDLRRTFLTIAESMDLSPYAYKRLVGHQVRDGQDVTAGYIASENDRLRSAAQSIADKIDEMAGAIKPPASPSL